MREVKLPLSQRGHARLLCEQQVYPLVEKATLVQLIACGPAIEDLWALTCGLGPLAAKEKRVQIFIYGAEDFPEIPASLRSGLEARLSILSSLHLRGLLEVFATSQHPPHSNKLLSSARPISLFSDLSDRVAVSWEKSLPFRGNGDVAVDFKWSFGDPQKEVERAEKELNRVKSAQPQPSWREGFTRFISTISPAAPEFAEDFDSVDQPLSGVQLFAHQEQAIRKWFENERHGIFKMCTGSGKTITSLAAVAERSKKAHSLGGKQLPVVVSVPTRVLADQWCKEITRFGFSSPLKAYNATKSWLPRLRAMLKSQNPGRCNFVVTTYKTFGDVRFVETLKELAREGFQALWIADEMHNLASSNMLKKMEALGEYFVERIGLSATPEIEDNKHATNRLFVYFQRGSTTTVGLYELLDGIRDKVLCEYDYYPFPQYLKAENSERFMNILRRLEAQEREGKIDIDLYRQKREILRTSGVQVQAFSSILQGLLQKSNERISHTLIYCPPGYSKSAVDALESDDEEDEVEEQRLLTDIIKLLADQNITVASILGETPQGQREQILREFKTGEIQMLCAVSCLDEGVDVPGIKTAIVLYSVDRAKQFIQRRGRILRRDPSNPSKVADIHDVIILPQGSHLPPSRREELLKREIKRYGDFAEFARNKDDADKMLRLALATASET